jgi:hypothetical protein
MYIYEIHLLNAVKNEVFRTFSRKIGRIPIAADIKQAYKGLLSEQRLRTWSNNGVPGERLITAGHRVYAASSNNQGSIDDHTHK